jgi:lipopolysaccharide export system permease protein
MVPLYFALSDIIVPRTNALATAVKENEIKNGKRSEEEETESPEMAWYRAGDQVIEAELFDPRNGEASNVVVYNIGDDGHPTSRIDAISARHVGDGQWRLHDARMIEVTADTVRRTSAPRYANLGATLPAEVSTRELSVAALSAEIAEMESAGHNAVAYKVDRHVKLAQPLACFILPALVLFFAVGGPPFPGPAKNLLVSIVVGVGYLLATGVAASFGYGGTVSPVIGGWGPNIGFVLIGGYFGLRLWRRL